MRRLSDKQREIFSDYLRKVALMAAASLIFGQFVPGTNIAWPVVMGGSFLSLGLIIGAALIDKEDKNYVHKF